jgi:hypothetical protein
MNEDPQSMEDNILAAITPSVFRKWLAISLLVLSGGLLIYFALSAEMAGFIWKSLMLAAGAGLVVLADRMRRATAQSIELTSTELRESGGRVLCLLDDIHSVERGAFSFKPSNGLLVRLKTRGPAGWAPGLWWRVGRKIGIGGVTSASQAKFMSDMIALQKTAESDRYTDK